MTAQLQPPHYPTPTKFRQEKLPRQMLTDSYRFNCAFACATTLAAVMPRSL
jgi:hypothetical protein